MSTENWMEGDERRNAKRAPRDEIAADFAGLGEIVDKAGLAELSGLTLYAVDECIKRGAPVQRRGSRKLSWQIHVGAFLAWYFRDKRAPAFADPKAEAFHNAKARRMVAQAERGEMDNAAVRAVTITTDQAKQIRAEEHALIRAVFSKIPGRCTSKLGETWTPQEFQTALVDAIDEALVELHADDKRSETHGNA